MSGHLPILTGRCPIRKLERSALPPVDRLVKLIDLLKRRRRTSLDHLADVCRVSSRTVYRDLNALVGLGYAVKNDRGYYLSTDPEIQLINPDNLELTPDELTLLQFCVEQNPLAGNHSFRKRFQSILGKLQSSFDTSRNNSRCLFQYQVSEGQIRRAAVDRILSKFEIALRANRRIRLILHDGNHDADLLVPIAIQLRPSGVWLVTQEQQTRNTREYPLASIKALSVFSPPSAASKKQEAR